MTDLNNKTDFREVSDHRVLAHTPMVSVLLFAYQHERFVAEAIEGVLAQECEFPIELIIGEDCSSDGTLSVALDYQKRYPGLIRVLTPVSNQGGHENVARCLTAARGVYIAMCDGDDYWHDSRKLQMQVEQLERNPNAQLVHTDYDRRVNNRTLRNAHKRLKTPYLASGDAFADLLHSMTVVTATVLYRRHLLIDLRDRKLVSESWPFGDYPIALYAALMGTVLYLPISTATYRVTQGSATNQGRSKFLQMRIAGAECREVFMGLRCLPAIVEHDVRVHMHQDLWSHAMLSGDRARYELEKAWLVANGSPPSRAQRFFGSMLVRHAYLLRLARGSLNIFGKLKYFAHSRRI